jgi:hypothetical protein
MNFLTLMSSFLLFSIVNSIEDVQPLKYAIQTLKYEKNGKEGEKSLEYLRALRNLNRNAIDYVKGTPPKITDSRGQLYDHISVSISNSKESSYNPQNKPAEQKQTKYKEPTGEKTIYNKPSETNPKEKDSNRYYRPEPFNGSPNYRPETVEPNYRPAGYIPKTAPQYATIYYEKEVKTTTTATTTTPRKPNYRPRPTKVLV